MVECEYDRSPESYSGGCVLIDTWWNVNMTPTAVCAIVLIVLIDTWWNVNEEPTTETRKATRFNRYMVECELFWSSGCNYSL